jgi:hypothetical protein
MSIPLNELTSASTTSDTSLNESNAAPCGASGAVINIHLDAITTNPDGSVVALGNTLGDNDNKFSVEVRANDVAAQQIQAEVTKAKAKGIPGIRIWAYGPCEVDFDRSKEGDLRVLKLCICADLVRPAHPLSKVEPLQNAGVFFGCPSITEKTGDNGKYYMGSLEFPHLTTQREGSSSSPAAVKLSGKSAEELFAYNGKDVMVSGRFTRQTGEMNGNPYDHISLSVSTACEIRIPGGMPRRAPAATTSNTVVTADYEVGFGDTSADLEAARAEFASADF